MDKIHVKELETMAHRYIIVLIRLGVERGILFSRRMEISRMMVKSLF